MKTHVKVVKDLDPHRGSLVLLPVASLNVEPPIQEF
jgi:hypothetical protein